MEHDLIRLVPKDECKRPGRTKITGMEAHIPCGAQAEAGSFRRAGTNVLPDVSGRM
jgi:hypothetical protein